MKIDFRKMFNNNPIITVNNQTSLSDGYYEILPFDKLIDGYNADGTGSQSTGNGLLIVQGKSYYTHPDRDPTPTRFDEKTFRVIKRANIHWPMINVENIDFEFFKL